MSEKSEIALQKGKYYSTVFDVGYKAGYEAREEKLIRCKDCRYWQDNNNGYPHPECRWGHEETPDAYDYCSFASDRRQFTKGQ